MMGTYVMKELKHTRSQALINILHIEKAGLNFFTLFRNVYNMLQVFHTFFVTLQHEMKKRAPDFVPIFFFYRRTCTTTLILGNTKCTHITHILVSQDSQLKQTYTASGYFLIPS